MVFVNIFLGCFQVISYMSTALSLTSSQVGRQARPGGARVGGGGGTGHGQDGQAAGVPRRSWFWVEKTWRYN